MGSVKQKPSIDSCFVSSFLIVLPQHIQTGEENEKSAGQKHEQSSSND
jgi:hypothetical protein